MHFFAPVRLPASAVLLLVFVGCSGIVEDEGTRTSAGSSGTTEATSGTGGASSGPSSGSGGAGGTAGVAVGSGSAGGSGGANGSTGASGRGGAAGTGSAGAAGRGGAGGAAGAGRDGGVAGGAGARDAAVADSSVGGDAGPGTSCGLANVVSKAMFDTIFPLMGRHALYTYEGFIAAAAAYPTFVNTGDLDTCRREAAAFLANVARETGRLRFAEQIAKAQYCSSRASCACDPATQDQTKWYYGRGPIQLSWNYNYCAAGTALGIDLLTQPSIVATDSVVAWKTALWFWMTRGGAGNATCHAAMTGGGGFGETIRTINGGVECGMGGYGAVEGVTERVDHYIDYARRFGVANPGTPQDLDC